MATKVQLKRSETTGSIPTANDIAVGELAVNLADGVLYSKRTDGSIIEVGGYNPDFFTVPSNIDLGELSASDYNTYDMGTL